MTVVPGWHIDLDEEQIHRTQGASLARVLANPRGRAAWTGALADARELVQGAALWEFFAVEAIRHGRVFLAGGARLGGGPLAQVIAGADHLGVVVCTIGPALGSRAHEQQRSGNLLRGLLLNNLGIWAVDKLRQEISCRIEDDAAAEGLRVSTSLSPGESDWPLSDQKVIFSMLETEQIGVSLNRKSLVMSPVKSVSLVMGRGVGPLGREGESHCDYCTIRDRCAYRGRRS